MVFELPTPLNLFARGFKVGFDVILPNLLQLLSPSNAVLEWADLVLRLHLIENLEIKLAKDEEFV